MIVLQRVLVPTDFSEASKAAVTYGVALGGAILLLVVDRQIGDVDAVRDVLAGDEVAHSSATNAAIGDGLAWTGAFATVVALVCCAAAMSLRRRADRESI